MSFKKKNWKNIFQARVFTLKYEQRRRLRIIQAPPAILAAMHLRKTLLLSNCVSVWLLLINKPRAIKTKQQNNKSAPPISPVKTNVKDWPFHTTLLNQSQMSPGKKKKLPSLPHYTPFPLTPTPPPHSLSCLRLCSSHDLAAFSQLSASFPLSLSFCLCRDGVLSGGCGPSCRPAQHSQPLKVKN